MFCNDNLFFQLTTQKQVFESFDCSNYFNKSFSCKTSLPDKSLYLLAFPDEKAKILAFGCLNHRDLCFA